MGEDEVFDEFRCAKYRVGILGERKEVESIGFSNYYPSLALAKG